MCLFLQLMYPDFQYLLQSLFGAPMPEWLSIFKTFGFLVALSFFFAGWTTVMELKRREQLGYLIPEYSSMEVGHPAKASELILSALTGFIIGFKIGGMFGHFADIAPNPMGYLFSIQGSWLIGILGALALGYMKYAEKKKQELAEPVTKRVATYPHQRIFEIAVIAAIGGLAGAKIFNAFETWDDFVAHPLENLLSSSGLTFYGGLIVATVALYFYTRKHKIPFVQMCDATAPGLMLAYGVGRLGCQLSGDGDWGIFNTAYVSNPDGSLRAAVDGDKVNALHMIANAPSAYYPGPSWLPHWLFGMNYPHNVNNEGASIVGCAGNYCHMLPVSVFPTPIYEAVVCILFFFLLWAIRKRFKYSLHLFGVYLILNGIERFCVEHIRVNYKYDWGFLHPTQAEIISVGLALAGVALLLFYKKKNETITVTTEPS